MRYVVRAMQAEGRRKPQDVELPAETFVIAPRVQDVVIFRVDKHTFKKVVKQVQIGQAKVVVVVTMDEREHLVFRNAVRAFGQEVVE